MGRLAGFVVVTIQDGEETTREIVGRPQQADGPGERRNNHVALLDPIGECDLLIAGGMGLPMARNIQERGIDLLLTTETSVEEALRKLVSGELEHDETRAHQPRY